MIHFDDTAPVKLKGVGGGLWLTLDPASPETLLMDEIDKVFTNLKHLAVNASVVIDMGGDDGHDDLFTRIKSRLLDKFAVARVTTSPRKQSVPTRRIRRRDLQKGWNHHRSDVLMLRGRVRSGQKVDTRKHVVICGDVNPGAEIMSGGDIIILGRLFGKVHAGCPENDGAMVFALCFDPTMVKIGTVTALGGAHTCRMLPEFACVAGDVILVQDYMKNSPFRNIPWPETV